MKRLLIGILLSFAAVLDCSVALGQNTQITASHLAYFGGATITGTFCVTPTNQAGQPITIVTPVGQQLSPQQPLCFTLTSGVLASNAIVPDTSQTQPANACYNVVINNRFGQQVGVFPCVQPSGTTWSFDAYVPSSLPSIPALTLPQFQLNGNPNAAQGYLDLICPSCTRSGGHITLPTGGGTGGVSGTFVFSPIVLRPGRVILLVPNQPIVLE